MTARRMLAAALIAAAGAGTAIADVTTETVIKTGDTPPGVESGSTVVGMEAKALGDGGHVNLAITLQGPTVDSTNNTCGFAGLPELLAMYWRNSAPADPIDGVFFNAGSFTWATGRPDSSGHVPLMAWGLSGSGVSTSDDSAVFLWNGVERSVLMREGDSAPGFDPLLGLTFPALSASATLPRLLDDGRFVNQMNFPVFGSPFNRLWLYSGTPAAPTLVIAPTEPVPGIPGTFWFSANSAACNGAGMCLIRAQLQTGVGGVTSSDDMTYWVGDPESPTLLMREGGAVPGLNPSDVSNLTSALFGESPINAAGEALFEVRLVEGVGDATVANDRAILFGTPGNLSLVERKGDPVPGLPGLTFFNPLNVASGDDQIGLSVLLSGAGVTSANDQAIVVGHPGALRVVFRDGAHAPGYPAGYTVGLLINDVWFNSYGNYAARADVLDDQGVVIGRATYVGDPVTGEPVLVAGAGFGIEVAPGDVRTVGSGSDDLPFAGVSGIGALLNNQDQFLFTARFTDGTRGAFLATVTAAPGPFFELDGAVTVNDSSGNGNGLLDPAESGIMLTIPLKNIGLDPSTGVSATLTSLTPTATVVNGTSAYANLAAGASGNNAAPFEIALDPSHPCAAPVQLRLNVVSSERSNDLFFVLPGGSSYPGCAVFAQGGTALISDSAGNGDGFADPGETIALTLPVAKVGGTGPSAAVTGTLTSLTPTATVTTAVANYPNLGPNESANNAAAYVIALAPSHPCGANVNLQLTVEADGGLASDVLQFGVQTGSRPVITTTVSWAGPSITIPDNDPAGVSVNVPVSGLSGTLGDLNVRFDSVSACSSSSSSLSGGIAHRSMGDLVITLTSPQGTSVVILNQQGDSNNHLCNAVFDDEAPAPFPACDQPHACSHQPFEALSAFNGENPNGAWTLNVTDVVSGTTPGSLQAFSLLLGTTTCANSCPADFNQSGAVSVQDIFDFLAAYFTSDPRADFNHSGAISVQDIFDFLAAYFTGC